MPPPINPSSEACSLSPCSHFSRCATVCVSSLSLFPVIYLSSEEPRGYVRSLATVLEERGGLEDAKARVEGFQPTQRMFHLLREHIYKATNAWSARIATIVHDNWKSQGYEPAAFPCDLLLLRIYYFRENWWREPGKLNRFLCVGSASMSYADWYLRTENEILRVSGTEFLGGSWKRVRWNSFESCSYIWISFKSITQWNPW